MFQPPRDRDAYASIRGYVYQIDRTIERWLELVAGQVLELERGEDIDRVGRLISVDGTAEAEERLLEQIKHREAALTLRTLAALEALANFHDHRVNNAGVELRFCFLTNAVVGCEQLNPFPERVPGITLWERVRTRQLAETEATAAVEHLRRFLAHSPRPDGLAEAVWMNWKTYLATATTEALREFVERFEWSTGQLDAQQLPVALRSQILALGFAHGEAEAEAVADRLFVHVARLLSTAGLKCLTVEDRVRMVDGPALSAADRDLLAQLRAVVAEHSDRLEELEANVSALGSQVETLFLAGTAERIDLNDPIPDLSFPLPVTRLSPRRQTAEGLCKALATSGWLALHGGPDVGKSQLAVQVATAHGRCRGWVRFHHAQATAEAAPQLDRALAALAGWAQVPQRTGWHAEALAAVGPGSLVVFDDLLRVPGDDALAERLIRFGQSAQATGVHVASTSQFEMPARLHHHLGGWLDDRPAPAFTDGEAGDLFRAHGASDSFLSERRLRFLNGQAAGHPLLLTATAEFLARRSWRYREEEIDVLLRGDHTQAILPEVVDRLTRTLSDSPRELLYRLTLPIDSFDQADLTALCGVAPPVDRPRERLNELLGAWVQRDTDARFAVSPLAKPLGRSELAADVRTRCYRELAEVITHRRVMNPLDGKRAILYNLEAGEPGRAITLYVLFLVETLKVRRTGHVMPFLDMWRETPLPGGLSVGNRLFVRAYQLAAFTRYGLDTRYVVRDIDGLLDQAADRDGWGIVALAGQSVGRILSQDPARALRYVRRAVELPTVYGPDGREILLDRVSLPDMLWMLVTDLRTPALLQQWLDAVETLPERHRARFWGSEISRQGVWVVPNKVHAYEKRPDDALGLLDAALSQPHGGNDQERLRCLLAANICVEVRDLCYAEQARDLARSSVEAPDIEAARALGEYALSAFQVTGGQAGAVTAFTAWSEAMRRFFWVSRKDKFWRDLLPLFGHATSYLTQMARVGQPPEEAYDGSPFVAPTRGFLLKDYMAEREALYREGGEASLAFLMGSYAAAAGASEEASHWMRLAVDESRRVGASLIRVASGTEVIAELLSNGRFEDALEMGVFVGRGLVAHRAAASEGRGNLEEVGVDLSAEFRKLPEDQRRLGDGFALISGVLPAAIALVRLSLIDPDAAVSAGQRVAALCSELAEDEWGERELWQTAAELFESTSVARTNAQQIVARIRNIAGQDEPANALKVLGYVLATWHAGPDEAISYQLSVIEILLRWFSARESLHRRVLTPYVESFWRHVARERRFAFRAPDLTVAAIEAALAAPEPDRISAVLSAAASSFRIRGAHEVLQRLRAPTT